MKTILSRKAAKAQRSDAQSLWQPSPFRGFAALRESIGGVSIEARDR
jgi:hypothetical protein